MLDHLKETDYGTPKRESTRDVAEHRGLGRQRALVAQR